MPENDSIESLDIAAGKQVRQSKGSRGGVTDLSADKHVQIDQSAVQGQKIPTRQQSGKQLVEKEKTTGASLKKSKLEKEAKEKAEALARAQELAENMVKKATNDLRD